MTVAELRDKLKDMPDDGVVFYVDVEYGITQVDDVTCKTPMYLFINKSGMEELDWDTVDSVDGNRVVEVQGVQLL